MLPLEVDVDAIKRKVLLCCLLIFGQNSWAIGKGKAKWVLNLYAQNGDGGHQIFDNSKNEEAYAFEPMLFVAYQINKKTNISGHFVFDTWTAASDTKLDESTGASGEGIKSQSRTSGSLAISRDHKSWRWSSQLGVSSEYDYRSLNFGGNLQKSFAQDNFVLSLSPQIYLDQARDFDIASNQTLNFKGRTIWSMDLSGSQLLTPNDVIQVSYTFIHMNGMLNNISNSVHVSSNPYNNNFSRYDERLPDKRLRHALSSKLVHAFNDENAGHISYRYYEDNWDINAQTAELGHRLSFNDDKSFLMLTYRFYDQSQSQYFKESFQVVETHMTSDSDLANFTSHRFGGHYSHKIEDSQIFGMLLANMEWSAATYFSSRSNGLQSQILQAGLGAEF